VAVEYRGEDYYLTTEDGITSVARCSLRQEGGGASAVLKLEGVVQDSQVSANVAVIGNTFHLFTKVRGERARGGRSVLLLVSYTN